MPRASSISACVGVVIIGRNEAPRLPACLASVAGRVRRTIYVDSGSSDNSRELARELGAEVIALDLELPFTAARARNTGWRALLKQDPGLQYIQFIDGDCELFPGWLEAGLEFLEEHPATAVASGRLRERYPGASVYNRLCDLEWNAPVGSETSCGGNAMMRLTALSECNGFDDSLIAGEEPELCFRLRQRGWVIQRLMAEMAFHDAAMHSFRQWWRRSRRAGTAVAHGYCLHGRSPERFCRRELMSLLSWGLGLPALTLLIACFSSWAALLLLAYPAQVLRLRRRFLKAGRIPRTDCGLYALHCVASKFPGLVGVLGILSDKLLARRSRLIEYK